MKELMSIIGISISNIPSKVLELNSGKKNYVHLVNNKNINTKWTVYEQKGKETERQNR